MEIDTTPVEQLSDEAIDRELFALAEFLWPERGIEWQAKAQERFNALQREIDRRHPMPDTTEEGWRH